MLCPPLFPVEAVWQAAMLWDLPIGGFELLWLTVGRSSADVICLVSVEVR